MTLDSLTKKALKLDRFLKYPSNTPLDHILDVILEESDTFIPWLGEAKIDWRCVSATPYIYPQGTALSWHTDSQKGGKTGAYTFYIHPRWKSNWGGELLVSESDMSEAVQPRFDRDRDDGLEKDGIFITPKPNRLVIIKGGTLHKIARVELAAGNNVRASVSGFFYEAKPIHSCNFYQYICHLP